MISNILITGASGFIGKAFVEALSTKKLGYNIFCGVRESTKRDDLEKFNVNFVNFDLNDHSTFSSAVKGMNIVVHFAALFNFHAPRDMLFKQNVEVIQAFAEACLSNGVQHLIYCSSTEVLGIIRNGNETSDYNPETNLGYYGVSKMEAEKIFLKIQAEKRLPLTIVRPTGVIGPGKCYPFNELVESIYRNALNARIFPGSGENYIHWTYIDDITQGFIKILQNPEKTIGEIFILAGDEVPTYKIMFSTIAEKLNRKPPVFIRYFPIKIGLLFWPLIHNYYKFKKLDLFPFKPGSLKNSTVSRSYSNKKVKEILGFQPNFSFEKGVEKTIEWMKDQGLLEN